MTRLKGLKKNRYELFNPVLYVVKFDSEHTVEVLATSARDAEIKTLHLQSDFGFYKSAQIKKARG
jgi:hypothetical protein